MESKVGFPSCDLLIVYPVSGGGLQDPTADSRDGIISAPRGLPERLPQTSTNPHCRQRTVIGGFAQDLLCQPTLSGHHRPLFSTCGEPYIDVGSQVRPPNNASVYQM